MTLLIRELSVRDPGTVPALLPLFQAAVAADLPGYPEPTESFLRWFLAPRTVRHRTCMVAYDGDRPVGYGCLEHDNEANRDMIHADLNVRPEDRAEVTVPLLDAYRAHARARGCSRVVVVVSDHGAGHEAVFAAEGGRRMSEDFHSQADLTAIDRARYAAWAQGSEKNAHYRIEHWSAPTPEHLLPSLIQTNEAMRDAPTGELDFAIAPPSVQRRRQSELELTAFGARIHLVAAFAEDGTMAGYHEATAFPDYRLAEIAHTAVSAKFRGHGLGLRLKAALALFLLEHEPQVEIISTWNDAGNTPMLRVNGELGYERAESWSSWQFDL